MATVYGNPDSANHHKRELLPRNSSDCLETTACSYPPPPRTHEHTSATLPLAPSKPAVGSQAWKDLYSFVILVMVPRTAMQLEESLRSAGTMTSMLRPTPMSGTRLKVTTSPGRINSRSSLPYHQQHQQQQSRGEGIGRGARGRSRLPGSPYALVGAPKSTTTTPRTCCEEQPWFGASVSPPVLRSASGSVSRRSTSGPWRKKMPKGKTNGISSRRSAANAVPVGGSSSGASGGGGERGGIGILGAPWGGIGVAGQPVGAPFADNVHSVYARDSPSSVTSSRTSASGLHLSLVGSVATVEGGDSFFVSPVGSAISTNGRGAWGRKTHGSSRRSKLLRGLGKMTGGKGSGSVGGIDSGGGRVPGSSPRGSTTLGARARAVLGSRPRRNTDGIGGAVSAVPGPLSSPGWRHDNRRSSSLGTAAAAAVATAAAAGVEEVAAFDAPEKRKGDGSYSGVGGGVRSVAFVASPSGRHRRRKSESSNENGSTPGLAAPGLAFPASSAISQPGSHSWEPSAAAALRASFPRGCGSGGICIPSKNKPGRAVIATTSSRTPATVSQDLKWCDSRNGGGRCGGVEDVNNAAGGGRSTVSASSHDECRTGGEERGSLIADPSTAAAAGAPTSRAPPLHLVEGGMAEPKTVLLPTANPNGRTEKKRGAEAAGWGRRHSSGESYFSHGGDGGGVGGDNKSFSGSGGGAARRNGGLPRVSPPKVPEHRSAGWEGHGHKADGSVEDDPHAVTPQQSMLSPPEPRTDCKRMAR